MHLETMNSKLERAVAILMGIGKVCDASRNRGPELKDRNSPLGTFLYELFIV
jgi:hypothetical protein